MINQIQLTKSSYEENGTHIVKLLKILSVFFKNGPLSKWQLATVNYRGKVKKGYTPFGWVLVHKIISEMVKFGLVRKFGKYNIKDNQSDKSKKHSVNLYYLTVSGLVFLFCADKWSYIHARKGELKINNFPDMKDLDYENMISLVSIVWNMQNLDDDSTKKIRSVMMEKIAGNNTSTDIQNIISNTLMSYLLEAVGKNISEVLSTGSKEQIGKGVIRLAILKNTISEIKQKDIRHQLAYSLEEKIAFSDLALKVTKSTYEYLSGYAWDRLERTKNRELELEQLYYRLMTIADLMSMSENLKPTLRIIKKIGGSISDLEKSDKAFSNFWKYKEK